MNRAFYLLANSCLIALLSAACLAQAAEPAAPAAAVPAKPDAAKGETLYTNGDASRNIPACVACHGAAGNSTIVQNPKLAAQHEDYLVKQLHDFTGPNRVNPVMTTIAKALTPQDMQNLAAYLTKQNEKPGAAHNKDTLDLGRKIYRAGIAEKNVPACAGCHSPNGAGIPIQYPRLAAQHQEYTATELMNFRSGARKNSPQMMAIAKRLSDDEMKAVADYIAGLR